MSIELKQLSTEDGEDVYDMLQEIGTNEYGFMNEVKGMSFDEYKLWLKQEDGYSRAENLPENWVPGTTFFLFIDEIPVGIGRIRHYSNENLEQRGVGNFGYGIAKPYRNKGYGSILFEKLLMKCKTFGYSKIKLYAYIDNIATNKIMLKNGAKLIGIFNGEKNIYEFSLY
ncbi:MAG: GNAT family N-acetyltransferase [Oscillospiraceae bacterium]|nr:GNAT family N-acetyltransferase [Oscillospiraceae bacterium]